MIQSQRRSCVDERAELVHHPALFGSQRFKRLRRVMEFTLLAHGLQAGGGLENRLRTEIPHGGLERVHRPSQEGPVSMVDGGAEVREQTRGFFEISFDDLPQQRPIALDRLDAADQLMMWLGGIGRSAMLSPLGRIQAGGRVRSLASTLAAWSGCAGGGAAISVSEAATVQNGNCQVARNGNPSRPLRKRSRSRRRGRRGEEYRDWRPDSGPSLPTSSERFPDGRNTQRSLCGLCGSA